MKDILDHKPVGQRESSRIHVEANY